MTNISWDLRCFDLKSCRCVCIQITDPQLSLCRYPSQINQSFDYEKAFWKAFLTHRRINKWLIGYSWTSINFYCCDFAHSFFLAIIFYSELYRIHVLSFPRALILFVAFTILLLFFLGVREIHLHMTTPSKAHKIPQHQNLNSNKVDLEEFSLDR